jgi:hypothetical protein
MSHRSRNKAPKYLAKPPKDTVAIWFEIKELKRDDPFPRGCKYSYYYNQEEKESIIKSYLKQSTGWMRTYTSKERWQRDYQTTTYSTSKTVGGVTGENKIIAVICHEEKVRAAWGEVAP